jgi:hypothetical protein
MNYMLAFARLHQTLSNTWSCSHAYHRYVTTLLSSAFVQGTQKWPRLAEHPVV